MQSEATRQSDWIEPPMFSGITCLTATSTIAIVDLTSMSGSPGNQVNGTDISVYGGKDVNPIGHYLTLEADGADIYVIFSDTVGHISGISNTTGVSTITNNLLVTSSTATGVIKIFNGTIQQFKLPTGSNPNQGTWGANSPARFLGFLTSAGSGTLRMWQSSP